MTIGIAEMQPRLRRMIQFVRRNVISLPISTVVGKPKLLGLRMPIKPDGIANAAGKYLEIAAVGFHAHDRGIAIRHPARKYCTARRLGRKAARPARKQ